MRRFRRTQQIVRVRDVFDDWAQSGRAERMEQSHQAAARVAFEALGVQPGHRFLDIGCGNGYAVRWAAETSGSVDALGLDVSSYMITLARELTTGLPNARFRRCSFPVNDLNQVGFDAILSVESLYYMPDIAAVLQAIHGMLTPNGHFACIIGYYRENTATHHWPDELGVSMHLLSSREWWQAFEDAGFSVVRQERLLMEPLADEEASWTHTSGSLFTMGKALR